MATGLLIKIIKLTSTCADRIRPSFSYTVIIFRNYAKTKTLNNIIAFSRYRENVVYIIKRRGKIQQTCRENEKRGNSAYGFSRFR